MGASQRVGICITVLSALVLMLVAAFPAVASGPATPAQAAPRAAQQASAEPSKVTLGDTSIDGPSLWTSNPGSPNLGLASALAWTGTDAAHSLNVMLSSDGLTYGGKVTFDENAASRPAVAVMGPPTTVVLAWTGIDPNHSLNLLCQGPACNAPAGTYKKATFTDNSFTSPALARFGNRFLLAWTGTDANHSLNIWPFTVASSGFQMGTKTILSQFSSIAQPSLAVNPQNNQLLLSWNATKPAEQLTFSTSADGVSWSGSQTVSDDTAAAAPAGFAVASTNMPASWMAWSGAGLDTAHHVNVRFTQSFPQWPLSGKTTLTETALGGPALGYGGNVGNMLLAWTGTDQQHHLNVATITSAGTPTLDQRIDSYIAGLSTTQLVGQTLMISVCTDSYNANITQALQQWEVGSAIIYTSCNNTGPHPPTAAGLQQLDQTMQNNANHAGTLIISTDQEGGTVDRLAPYFGSTPSARQLGNSGNPQNAYNQAQTDAGRMRSVGLNTDLAPVVDVDQGGGEGPDRMFGTSVGTVTTYAGAFLDGLQQNGVAGTLKHWPGLGAATGNPDFVLPTINASQATLQAIDFAPFANLLYQAPGMIMVTTVMVPAYDSHAPADLSSTLVSSVLRGQYGYQGVVVTDTLGGQGLINYMQQQGYSNATQGIAEASVRAFLAGDDVLLCPLGQSTQQAIVNAMTQAVQSGRISRTQLLTSVHRIIRLKIEMGLMAVP